MPPLPTIPHAWRVVFNWRHSTTSQTAHNVMHFVDTASDSATVKTHIFSHVTSAMWDFVAPNAVVDSITITDLSSTFASITYPTTGVSPWLGAGTGTDYIPQGAGVVTLYTSERGRSHRGRIYLPFVAEGEQTQGQLQDVTACQNAWTNFLTAMNATTTIPAVASYKLSEANSVTSYLVRSKLRTQRRRALK